MKQRKDEITFSDIITVFAPKIWIIVIVSIVCAAVLGVYSMFLKEDTYTSSATMYVYRPSQSPTANDLLLAESMIETYSLLLSSTDVLKEVITRMPNEYEGKDSLSVDQVRAATKFISGGNGYYVISVTTTDPVLSFYLASSFEVVAIEFIKLKIPNALPVVSFQSPENTVKPNGKGTVKNALFGFVAGAAVSTVAVVAFSFFDSVVRSKKKLEDNLNAPILGVIPVFQNRVNSKTEV